LKVYHSLESVSGIRNSVITTGTFDGVHLGHQKILHQLNRLAKSCNGESVLLTFFPHPRMVLFPDDHGLKLLNTLDEKIALLEKTGLDNLIIQPFSEAFSRLSALQYVRDIMVNQLNVSNMVVGYDHHFGRNREGNIETLKEFSTTFDFNITEISALEIEEVNVSSTKIRNAILAGQIQMANGYLGYNYSFSGTVIEGEKRGRELGYKTANLSIEDDLKIIPPNGVYAVTATVGDGEFKGMLNIGFNPTFHDGEKTNIEVHILDFDQNIYGQKVTLHLVKRIRNEQKFGSKEELVQQLSTDKRITYEILS